MDEATREWLSPYFSPRLGGCEGPAFRLSLSWSQGTGSISSVSSAFCVPAGWPPESWGEWVGIEASFGGSLLRGGGAGHQPLIASLRHLPWEDPRLGRRGWCGARRQWPSPPVQLGDWTQYFKMFPKFPWQWFLLPWRGGSSTAFLWIQSPARGDISYKSAVSPGRTELGHLAFGGGGQKDTTSPPRQVLWCAYNEPHKRTCKDQVLPPICAPLNLKGAFIFQCFIMCIAVWLCSPFPKEAGTLKVIIWIPCWCFLLFRVFPSALVPVTVLGAVMG